MKIRIMPSGEIHMDTNGAPPAEVAGVILSIQRELRRDTKPPAKRPPSLSGNLAATYDYLIDNDSELGIHLSAVAENFGITSGAAGQRIHKLIRHGLAERVSSGVYRGVGE